MAKSARPGRHIERIFLLLSSAILVFLFFQLHEVLKKNFTEVDKRLADGSMVNLNAPDAGNAARNLLEKGFYFRDPRDRDLVTSIIARNVNEQAGSIDNVGELNKSRYSVSAAEAFNKGGEAFRKRVVASRTLVGFNGSDSLRFQQELTSPPKFPAAVNLNSGKYKISGKIVNRERQPVSGVLVKLRLVLPSDSLSSGEELDETGIKKEEGIGFVRTFLQDSLGHRSLQSLAAYARTDAEGNYLFQNLPDSLTYEVLPLQPNYVFGSAKGTTSLVEDQNLGFVQSVHTLRLLTSREFSILRKEGAFIVRMPEEFSHWFWIIGISIVASFLLLHLVISIKFPEADQIILPVTMLLTGLSFVTLLSMQDPLRDRYLGKDTLYYFIAGIVLMLALLFINLRRFNTDSKLYRLFVFQGRSAANGWPVAMLAMGLLCLTILFGTGPQGSGVKVNLFGFQPSEIVKFLIVVFLAGFFATNEQFISAYRNWTKRWQFFYVALLSILFLILLFLILGDLGPAMVVCFTFIILFSFSRGDFLFMAFAVALYVLSCWLIDNVWIATGVAAAVLAIIMLFVRKQLSEAAIMALVVVAGFLLIDQVPYLGKLFPGPVERLSQRKAIWLDAWDNEVFGGDQVANGIWAMAGGGIQGQGIGEGFARTIPEAHTDMILPALGEEFGWAGIVSVFILFLLYLHRAIVIGRQSGRPFLFYLASGVGICTFVQFLLIAGGSTGALPLSGVALPFISYGGSSLIMNLLAAGFLLSVSLVRGSAVQMNYLAKQQDRNLVPALLVAFTAIVLLTVNISRYLFNNREWVVKPALVADRSGARMFSYNPRISILMNKLQAGDIYDRSGRVLATSHPEKVLPQMDSLAAAGVRYDLDSATHSRPDRYYPFGADMFFWTGDANTGIFMGSTNGYYTEYVMAPELRGFHTPVKNRVTQASRFREARFLPAVSREMTVAQLDYSELAPLLLAGVNSEAVERFKQRNRDVQLTLDAGLQSRLNRAMAMDTALQDNRVSVVVMESSTGDVLSSSMFPLPRINDWDFMTMSTAEQNQLNYWTNISDAGFTLATQPGSTAKLATSLAAFNKMGPAAAKRTFQVQAYERIRTKGLEPDETGTITMERAIVGSNNVYFIKLANEEHLQEQMADIYMKTGMFLKGVGGYLYGAPTASAGERERWMELWRKTEFNTRPRYNPNNIRLTRAKGISGMAWGQGELVATPASVARLASSISNQGLLYPDRMVMRISDSLTSPGAPTQVAADSSYARLITGYMIKQSANKTPRLGISVAGKTGTPERVLKGERVNDGWYVFFAPSAKGSGNIVVCIRIESTKGSSDAVKLAGEQVIPILRQMGYIKGFGNEAPKPPTP